MPPKKLRPSKCRSSCGGAIFVEAGTAVVAGSDEVGTLVGVVGLTVVGLSVGFIVVGVGFVVGGTTVVGFVGTAVVVSIVGDGGLGFGGSVMWASEVLLLEVSGALETLEAFEVALLVGVITFEVTVGLATVLAETDELEGGTAVVVSSFAC